MQKAALYTSGVFFAVGAIAHLLRLIAGVEIVIGGLVTPVWGSFPGAHIAALLSVWMLAAARRAQTGRRGGGFQSASHGAARSSGSRGQRATFMRTTSKPWPDFA